MRKRPLLVAMVVVVVGLLVYVWVNESEKEKNVVVHEVSSDSIQELWYKNSIIYTLDVEAFKDSNGDGTRDFNGLTSKLDYINSLGVDAIWLAPFQPTPNKDDGYDISDFYKIDQRLGTLEDFRNLMDEAKDHGFKVIMDLVANHTSDQHPWFQEARSRENSSYRSWYVWSEERPSNFDRGMVFPGV
jgi:maltose alpha-D-glucosyltransferase / alpha-amylase